MRRNNPELRSLAVFSRNYRSHLEAAVARGKELTTFRSQARWVTVRDAVAKRPCVIYFAVSDEGVDVQYTAEIVDVLVDVAQNAAAADHLLSHRPETTDEEDPLWNGKVKTLYAIRNCRPVDPGFPFFTLRSFKTEGTLDPNYGRAYALVCERPEGPHRE